MCSFRGLQGCYTRLSHDHIPGMQCPPQPNPPPRTPREVSEISMYNPQPGRRSIQAIASTDGQLKARTQHHQQITTSTDCLNSNPPPGLSALVTIGTHLL